MTDLLTMKANTWRQCFYLNVKFSFGKTNGYQENNFNQTYRVIFTCD